jgi:hypothetical protein
MRGKRTNVDFSKHEVITTQVEGLLVHHFKRPDTFTHSIKYINTNGILAVTGDYGNWIFCREFHPGPNEFVSDQYWFEKLKINSCQVAFTYSPEETEKAIQDRLNELEEWGFKGNELEEMTTYYENCLEYLSDEYMYVAEAFKYPKFADHSSAMIFCKAVNPWLEVVFDGFDEICRRILSEKHPIPPDLDF